MRISILILNLFVFFLLLQYEIKLQIIQEKTFQKKLHKIDINLPGITNKKTELLSYGY